MFSFFPVECRSAYHEKHTERCLQCGEPVAPKKGKFSGEFFELEEGKGRLHSECYDAYEEANADRCLVCKKAVRRMEGFSGDFMVVEGGKVHKVGRWKESRIGLSRLRLPNPLFVMSRCYVCSILWVFTRLSATALYALVADSLCTYHRNRLGFQASHQLFEALSSGEAGVARRTNLCFADK